MAQPATGARPAPWGLEFIPRACAAVTLATTIPFWGADSGAPLAPGRCEQGICSGPGSPGLTFPHRCRRPVHGPAGRCVHDRRFLLGRRRLHLDLPGAVSRVLLHLEMPGVHPGGRPGLRPTLGALRSPSLSLFHGHLKRPLPPVRPHSVRSSAPASPPEGASSS